ncbi:MAG: UbiD family decarboxylase, partial [Methanomassiliicoccales archaeon]
MPYYKDLREYLDALELQGKLIRVKSEINKDTEMHPLMRLQFRGLPEAERKGFVFENVVDSRGTKYDIPVACCVLAGSKDIYALGMMCQPEEISQKWTQAELNPIETKLVGKGPVQEEVHMGENLLQHGGLDEFPVPISTPGYDVAPYITAPCWVTKDPETHIRNVGTYRAQLKSPLCTGIMVSSPRQHIAMHWEKCKERGIPLEAVIAIGGAPNIGYVSIAKLPHGLDELGVAGGIAGAPVEIVKCKTVDLEVPAYAEIAIEGYLSTTDVEAEGPFGEAP